MQMKGYEYFTNDKFLDYEFVSSGPKGEIKKVVRFSIIPDYDNIYNLAFGDLDEKSGDIKDSVVSNNADTEKVLSTVAKIAYDFTSIYLEASIFVVGSTASRTRLYQINIAKHWQEINQFFEIKGLRSGKWEHFEKNRNYDAFLAKRRNGAFFV
jgi:hypothetical protein